MIANEQALILLTEHGYIKRMPVNTFKAQNRATRGKYGTRMKEDDGVEHFLTCCDHDSVLFFSQRGVVYSLNAYQIPAASRTARGMPIVQMLPIPMDEKITSLVAVSEFRDDEYLVMLTKGGYIKKTTLAAFSNIRANGLIAISLQEGDELCWVRRATEEDSVIIGSSQGKAIHFRTNAVQLRASGRTSRGVRSMKLVDGDELIGMDILPRNIVASLENDATESDSEAEDNLAENLDTEADDIDAEKAETEAEELAVDNSTGPWVLIVTNNGYGKRTPVSQFRLQRRAGKGLIAAKLNSRKSKSRKSKDELAALRIVNVDDELMMITSRGIIVRQAVNAISIQSRGATGVRVQRLDEDDAIAAVALVPPLAEEAGDLEEE